jgi:hypothetical protein
LQLDCQMSFLENCEKMVPRVIKTVDVDSFGFSESWQPMRTGALSFLLFRLRQSIHNIVPHASSQLWIRFGRIKIAQGVSTGRIGRQCLIQRMSTRYFGEMDIDPLDGRKIRKRICRRCAIGRLGFFHDTHRPGPPNQQASFCFFTVIAQHAFSFLSSSPRSTPFISFLQDGPTRATHAAFEKDKCPRQRRGGRSSVERAAMRSFEMLNLAHVLIPNVRCCSCDAKV